MSRKHTRRHKSRIPGDYQPGEQLAESFSLGGRVVRDPRLALDWYREVDKRMRSGSLDRLIAQVESDFLFFPEVRARWARAFSRPQGKDNLS